MNIEEIEELENRGNGVMRILILHALIVLIGMGFWGMVRRYPNTDIYFWIFAALELLWIFAICKIVFWYRG